MAKLLGIIGKPNVGKSTFFNAATLAGAEVNNYPFTTIKANTGVGYYRSPCPCKELEVACSPKHGACVNHERMVPMSLLDVAGLVPGAHLGKGLGNEFLNDLSRADALIHVVDAAGSTDDSGNPVEPGTHSPIHDVNFLETELDLWFFKILNTNWAKISKPIQMGKKDIALKLAMKLGGIGINAHQIQKAAKEKDLDIEKPANWTEDQLKEFASSLRTISKPILIVANKCDLEASEKGLIELNNESIKHIPASADSELALRKAAEINLISYVPGNSEFKPGPELSDDQKRGLDYVKDNVLKAFGNTGVQQSLNSAVEDMLNLIVVYTVEDENKFTDQKGNVLPDAHLVQRGTTAKDMAYKVHTDIGDNFIAAIDARTKKKIGADSELEDRAIIKIVTK